jgi:hypothetical protein
MHREECSRILRLQFGTDYIIPFRIVYKVCHSEILFQYKMAGILIHKTKT